METEVWVELIILAECDEAGKVDLAAVQKEMEKAVANSESQFHICNIACGLGL